MIQELADMLPSLKKIHSVDYASPQRQLEGASVGTGTTRNPPLMHSVSIVVELAVEKQPADEEDLEESIDIKDSMIGEKRQSDLSSSQQTKELGGTISTKSRGDNDDYDEEEEEEDDEAASCLSSDLARKVVIVDEADKILQFRAQSAEPRIGVTSSTLGDVGIETVDDVGLLSLSGIKTTGDCATQKPAGILSSGPAGTRSTTMRSNTIAGRECPSISSALRDSRKWQRANTQAGPFSSTSGASGSAGELAERGELGKLGMRRYTHHQVIYHPPIGGVGGGSTSSSAMLPRAAHSAQLDTDCLQKKSVGGNILAQSFQRRHHHQQDGDQSMHYWQSSASSPTSSSPLLALSGGLTSLAAAEVEVEAAAKLASGSGSVKNWPQRRQSLQINLLGSCGSGVCKSLTQEELRGEREFNEQVRNAKSPDSSLSGTLHQQYPSQYQQKLSSFSSSVAASQVLKCQSRAPALEGIGLASITSSTKTKSATQKADQSGQSDNIGKITQSSSQETTKTCYRQISDLPAPSQLLSGGAITYKPTRQSPTAQFQAGKRRVSFGSIDPIIDRAEPLSPPFGLNLPLQHSDDIAGAQRNEFENIQDSSPTKSQLNNSSGTRFANPTALKFDRTKQQTSCLKSIAGQKRHSLAASATSFLYSGIDPFDRKFARTDDNQPPIVDATVSKSYDREEYKSNENCSLARSTISSTRKMNDNSSPKAEPEKEGDIDATVNRPHLEAFSTTLDGQEITDETRITSSTASRPQQPQVKDGSRVQSIMANAKLRQEEFARLLEEHEQIVNEINRVETKMSNSQTSTQQQRKQQQENK